MLDFIEVYISLSKFKLDIHDRKGVHQNGLFIYFGGSNHLVYISWTVCCSLDPVLVIGCVILCIFIFANPMALFKFKKRGIGFI